MIFNLAQVFGAAGFASVRGTRTVRLPNPSSLQLGITIAYLEEFFQCFTSAQKKAQLLTGLDDYNKNRS